MTHFTKKKYFRIIVALLACIAIIYAKPAGALIIEPDPDLHVIMGDLHALAVAMRLYYTDTRRTQSPGLDELARYLKKPLPDDWPAGYRTATLLCGWWVGRKVPEFSAARRFLRYNAPLLGLYEQEGQSAWMGGTFVWMNALPFNENAKPAPETAVFKVAQGEGDDRHYLFFNSPGTDFYWRSRLIYTAEAHAEALKKFAADVERPLVVPAAPRRAQEALMASPVELPPDFTVGRDEEKLDVSLGGLILNPSLRR